MIRKAIGSLTPGDLCVAGRFEDVHRVVPCILASLGTLQAS